MTNNETTWGELFHEIGMLMAKMEKAGRNNEKIPQQKWLNLQDGLLQSFKKHEAKQAKSICESVPCSRDYHDFGDYAFDVDQWKKETLSRYQ